MMISVSKVSSKYSGFVLFWIKINTI